MVGSSRPKSFVRVAQELSNPLHAIRLTAAMLREDVTDLQQGFELDVIRAQAARARRKGATHHAIGLDTAAL